MFVEQMTGAANCQNMPKPWALIVAGSLQSSLAVGQFRILKETSHEHGDLSDDQMAIYS